MTRVNGLSVRDSCLSNQLESKPEGAVDASKSIAVCVHTTSTHLYLTYSRRLKMYGLCPMASIQQLGLFVPAAPDGNLAN